MNRIELLNLHALRNNEHYQFMTDVNGLIVKYDAPELGIDSFYPAFTNELSAEEIAMRVEQGSSKSKFIEQLDLQRDRTWNAIYNKVKATMLSPIDDEVTSAEVIMRIFNSYGDIRNLSYNEESAAMSNLISDLLQGSNTNHLTKVGISVWVSEMKNLNDNFQTAFNERNTEYAGRQDGDVRKVRKAIDPVYNSIIEKINASMVMGVAKPIATNFTFELNEKISYYKTTIAARSSRSKSKEKSNGVETLTDKA